MTKYNPKVNVMFPLAYNIGFKRRQNNIDRKAINTTDLPICSMYSNARQRGQLSA